MKHRLAIVVFVLCTPALALGGCPRKEQKKPTREEKAAVRSRAADAFADLGSAEHGEPAPAPKPEPKPEPKPPAKKVAQKKVDTVPVNPSRSAPAWINSQPNMPGYYVGIGVSTSHGDEEVDWTRARNNAYKELASSLKVKINSVITDYFKENSLKLYKNDSLVGGATRSQSSYTDDTKVFIDQTLEGVEIHDRWKDGEQNKYWMLVRLSKAEIARRLREKLEKARKKALDYVKAAVRAESTSNVAGALKGYFKSYMALREYFGGVVEYDVDGDGKKDVLNHEIERAVDRLAAGMDWKVDEANRKGVNGQGLKDPLSVTISYKGKPVNALPVAFTFQRGKGSVEEKVATEADGVAKARVVKVFGDKKAIVDVRVDVATLMDNKGETNIVMAKFGNAVERKTGRFLIELEELSAYIDITEELFGEEAGQSVIAADIKDRLHAELGLVFTKSSRGADMEIKGKAVVAAGACTDFFNQRQCTARVNVTVTDRLQGRQLFSKKYNVKGNGENDREAGLAALNKVGKRIAKKIIEGMK